MSRPAGSRRRRGRFGVRTTPKFRSRQRCFPCFGSARSVTAGKATSGRRRANRRASDGAARRSMRASKAPEHGAPRGTFRLAGTPTAQHIGHVSNVSRADDPDEGSLAEERPPDRVGDARSSGAAPFSADDEGGVTSCSGSSSRAIFSTTPRGRGWPQQVARAGDTSSPVWSAPGGYGWGHQSRTPLGNHTTSRPKVQRSRVAPTRRGPRTSMRISVSFSASDISNG